MSLIRLVLLLVNTMRSSTCRSLREFKKVNDYNADQTRKIIASRWTWKMWFFKQTKDLLIVNSFSEIYYYYFWLGFILLHDGITCCSVVVGLVNIYRSHLLCLNNIEHFCFTLCLFFFLKHTKRTHCFLQNANETD